MARGGSRKGAGRKKTGKRAGGPHLHLIVEAANRKALSDGMKSFATRAARAINNDSGSCGKVFTYRYHSTQIRTARYARHALAYVLNNWRSHREDFANRRMLTAYLDEYSSALGFDGWTMTFARPRDYLVDTFRAESTDHERPHTAGWQ
jgi:hypothetical protein